VKFSVVGSLPPTLTRLFILLGFSCTQQLRLSSEQHQFHSVHPPFVRVILFQDLRLSKRKTRPPPKKKEAIRNSSILTLLISYRKPFESAIDICVQLLQSRYRTRTSGRAVRCGCTVDGNVEKFRSEIEAHLPVAHSQMTISAVSEFLRPSASLVACNKYTASH